MWPTSGVLTGPQSLARHWPFPLPSYFQFSPSAFWSAAGDWTPRDRSPSRGGAPAGPGMPSGVTPTPKPQGEGRAERMLGTGKDTACFESAFHIACCGCWHSVLPVVLRASRKGFGVFVKGRTADNKRWQSSPRSAADRLAEEGESCLERKPGGRAPTGADRGTVTNFLVFLHRCCPKVLPCVGQGDCSRTLIIAASNCSAREAFFRVVRLSESLSKFCSGWIAANRDSLRKWSK